jgi:malic enzyme
MDGFVPRILLACTGRSESQSRSDFPTRSVIVSGTQRVTQRMLDLASKAIAQHANPTQPGSGSLPDIEDLGAISAVVAEAVYRAAVQDGVATKTHDNIVQAILDTRGPPNTTSTLPVTSMTAHREESYDDV